MVGGTIYRCTDGSYYGDVDVWSRLESGVWRTCCWDDETGEEWVENRDGALLMLEPISRDTVPDETDVDHVGDGISIDSNGKRSDQY